MNSLDQNVKQKTTEGTYSTLQNLHSALCSSTALWGRQRTMTACMCAVDTMGSHLSTPWSATNQTEMSGV
jgi:hypothetical protein